jgi:2-oxopent-4-enoate hydratase
VATQASTGGYKRREAQMTLSSEQLEQAAHALSRAEKTCSPIAPLTEKFPGLTVEDAYGIQLHNVSDRVKAKEVVRGYKVGLTSKAMRDQLGVDQPDFGHLFSSMILDTEAELSGNDFIAPRVELEAAFVLSRDLEGPGVTVADVLRATELVLPAIELIDSRIENWRIAFEDTVADNASAARVILGAQGASPQHLDLRLAGGALFRNGSLMETGCMVAVMGHPAVAVAWLANTLGSRGISFKAGDVVMPGSCIKAVDLRQGDVIHAEVAGLGCVDLSVS